MSLGTIKEKSGRMVVVEFFSARDRAREVQAYKALLDSGSLKRGEVDLFPVGASDLLIAFPTEALALAWRKRHAKRQKAYNEQVRLEALERLAEHYGPGAKLGTPTVHVAK